MTRRYVKMTNEIAIRMMMMMMMMVMVVMMMTVSVTVMMVMMNYHLFPVMLDTWKDTRSMVMSKSITKIIIIIIIIIIT